MVPCEFETPPFGQIAHAEEHRFLFVPGDSCSDYLQEPPTLTSPHSDLNERARLLALHTRDRTKDELAILGVHEFERREVDGVLEPTVEQSFTRTVPPLQPAEGVEHDHGVR